MLKLPFRGSSCFRDRFFFLVLVGMSLQVSGQADLQRGRHYYAIQHLGTGEIILRGRAGSLGIAHPPNSLILGPQTAYRHWVLQAKTIQIGFVDFQTPTSGGRFNLADLFLGTSHSPDSDQDGLHDEGELVIGTDPANPDTDGDGIPDGVEVVRLGNPLDGVPVQTGIVGSLSLLGNTLDVEAADNLAVTVGNGSGVTLLNVFNGMDPKRIGYVGLADEAWASAIDPPFVAVANDDAGLAVINISTLATPNLQHQVPLPAKTVAVAAFCGQALAGGDNGTLSRVDLETGVVLESHLVGNGIHDIALFGDQIYVLTASELVILDVSLQGFPERGRIAVTGNPSPLEVGRKLFVGGTLAYVGTFTGFKVIDVSNPAAPVLVGEPPSTQEAIHHIAAAGNGRVLASTSFAGPNSLRMSQYDGQDPSDVTRLLSVFETPGQPRGFAIYNGFAYVADTNRGLTVLNYQSADSARLPPSVSLSANVIGNEVTEGSLLRVTAMATDDVHVRNVTFFLNDQPLFTDGNFPFEHRFKVPYFSGSDRIRIQARASDTGGNTSWSGDLDFDVQPDRIRQPQVVDHNPAEGTTHEFLDEVAAAFNKTMDHATVTQASWEVVEAGPDTVFDTADDVAVTLDEVGVRLEPFGITGKKSGGFKAGLYRATATTATKDFAGVGLAIPFQWQFTVLQPFVTGVSPPDTSVHEFLNEFHITFNKPMAASSFNQATLILEQPGPDGVFDTVDDVPMAGGITVYEPESFRVFRRFPAGLSASLYRVRATTGITDSAGSPLEGEVEWKFTVTAPEVTAFSPANGSMNQTLTSVRATFSRAMDPATLTTQSFKLVEAGTDGVFDTGDDFSINYGALNLSPDGLQATFFFGEGMASGLIRAQLTTDLRDTGGQPLASDSSWSFSVAAPRVANSFPMDNDQAQLLDVITLFFDKPINPATLTTSSFELREAGLDGVFDTGDDVLINQGSPSYSNRTARRDFPNGLASGTYRVRVAASIADIHGYPLNGEKLIHFDHEGGTTLRGEVRFADGMPAPGVTVTTLGSNVANKSSTTTAADGSFAIPNISTTLFQIIRVGASWIQGATTYRGAKEISDFVQDGFTEVGTIALLPFCDSVFETDLFVTDQSVDQPVYALQAFDDGSGPALYLGGGFSQAGTQTANYVAKWNGTAFSALGTGVNDVVEALASFDDGTGSALYAGGYFNEAGGQPANRIAKWNGTAWLALGIGLNGRVRAMTVFNDGNGPALYVGGNFTMAGGSPASFVARWKNSAWEPLGDGTDGTVYTLAAFDDGNGLRLYAGGEFFSAGGTTVRNIARWDGGSQWTALDQGLDGPVRTLGVHDDGTGTALYAGGEFATTGSGQPMLAIARWNGANWVSLGNGITGSGGGGHKRHGKTPFGQPGMVAALASFDDGTGSALFATGTFDYAGGSMATNIAKWQAGAWWPIGNGLTTPSDINNEPLVGRALLPLMLGKSQALYLGGAFTGVDYNTSLFLARILCSSNPSPTPTKPEAGR